MTNDHNDWWKVEEGGGLMKKMGERFADRNEKLLHL